MVRPPYQGLGQTRLLEVAGAVIPLSQRPKPATDLVTAAHGAGRAAGFDMTQLIDAPTGPRRRFRRRQGAERAGRRGATPVRRLQRPRPPPAARRPSRPRSERGARQRCSTRCSRASANLQSEGLTMVAIDGVDGAGKTRFADDLAARLEADGQVAVRVGIDGFHNPRAVRYARGKDSPEGYYPRHLRSRGAADLAAVSGAHRQCRSSTAVFDERRDRPMAVNPLIVPLPAVLVFDGLFLNRDGAARRMGSVDLSRRAVRGGVRADGGARRQRSEPGGAGEPALARGQKLYFKESRPQKSADVVIDYADWTSRRLRG